MSKVALITGASSGIGLQAAVDLLEKGYTVYGAARRTNLMKALKEKGGKSLFLDLTDDSSIVNCVNEIIQKEGRIDVLVNNSGFGLGGGLEGVPISEAKNQFEVNVFGLARITQLVLPVMRKQRSGRIINVSSMAGRFSTPFSGWYHASKYSVEALSDALRLEVKPLGIKVSIIEPGTIKTNWGIIHAGNIRKFGGDADYKVGFEAAAKWFEKQYREDGPSSDSSVISKAIVNAVISKHPKIRYKTGNGSKFNIFIKRIVGDRLFDFIIRMNLGV